MKKANTILIVGILLSYIATIGIGALSDPVSTVDRSSSGRYFVPVSQATDWVTLVTTLDTADNGGSAVVNPGGITRSAQRRLKLAAAGTTVQVRVRYATGSTITAGTLQGFGLDNNTVPERLFDSTGTHSLSFLSDATNDPQDGTYSYTASQEVDANAAAFVMFAVKTAFTGTGAAAAVVQVRVK